MNAPRKIIVISGASSGFGALAARALARAGHTVHAGMRDTAGRNAAQVAAVMTYATERSVDLRTVELDVSSQESADAAIATIIEAHGRLDVVVHAAELACELNPKLRRAHQGAAPGGRLM